VSDLSSVEYQPHPGYLDAITLIHLPNGPTVYFKLTSIELSTHPRDFVQDAVR